MLSQVKIRRMMRGELAATTRVKGELTNKMSLQTKVQIQMGNVKASHRTSRVKER